MNKKLCVPDNDANILRFLSIAGGNATTETGEFWMDLDAYPSLDLCPGRTRVFSLRAAPWKLAGRPPTSLLLRCNLQSRVLQAASSVRHERDLRLLLLRRINRLL